MSDLEIIEVLKNKGHELFEITVEEYYEQKDSSFSLPSYEYNNSYVLLNNSVIHLEIDFVARDEDGFHIDYTDFKDEDLNVNFNPLDQEDLEYITKLTNLEILSIGGNELSELPDSFGNLKNLKALSLARNKFTYIPEVIFDFNKLEKLYLYKNEIANIPKRIEKLKKLTDLTINYNKIEEIPVFFYKLNKLTSLWLDHNQIEEITNDISNLKSLKILGLHNNKLKKIPNVLTKLTELDTITFRDNNFEFSKELLRSDAKEQILYILSLQNSQNQPLNEAKLIVVGTERVGKTSIINRIVSQDYDKNQETTQGIDILHYKLKNDIKLNIWDFAGQEITQQTHQFFLSRRSLYLLVLDAQEEDNNSKIYNWLNVIKTNGGSSPIIIVVNKIDRNKSFTFDINRYQDDFNIVDVFYISAENEINIENLIDSVENESIKLEGVTDLIPLEWFKIKEELEKFSNDKKDFIEKSGFESLCEKHGVINIDTQDTLLKILNQIGTIVTYEDHSRLNMMQIINPLWVTNGVYKIIRSHIIDDTEGYIDSKILKQIFQGDDRYKERHYTWLIDLLNKFEVSFNIDISNSRSLIPAKISANKPSFDLLEYQKGLNFQYEYPIILKKSLISQFIVKMHRYIDNSKDIKYWQRGVFLKYYNSNAVVISDEDKRLIVVAINTDEKQGRDFLAIIRHTFKEINHNKYKPNEKVALLVSGEIVGYEDYDYLIGCEKSGVSELPLKVTSAQKIHMFRIANLLDGYRLEENSGFDYENLTFDLVSISFLLTESRKSIYFEDENTINDRYRTSLLLKEYSASDQSRGGESESGKSLGSRDIVIRDKRRGSAETIIEAFNLDSLDTTVIDKHYEKLIVKYDTLGNKRNFILIYVKTESYNSLWNKYKNHFDNFEEKSEKYSGKEYIKVGISKYKNMEILHIFINFFSK